MELTIKKSKKKLSNQWIGFFFAVIPLIGFAVFSLVPAIISLIASFSTMTGYRLSSMQLTAPLFKNYIDAITDEYFFHSVGISFYITLNQIIALFVAIIVATFINRKVKGTEFFSTVYFIPYICSGVAVAFMWSRLFHTEYGVINSLLYGVFGESYPKLFGVQPIGGIYTNINWFGTSHLFVPVIIVILVWSAAGYGIVVLGAALVGVDKNLYEAAEIDGAGELKQFFKITIPQISPTIYFLLMLGLLHGLQTFDIVMVLVGDSWTEYGPDRMGQTLMLYIYKLGRDQNPNMPLSSAMSWLLFILVFVIQRLNEFISRRWVHSE